MSSLLPMHNYQSRAVAWGLSRDYGYFAVDMGLGKTRIILEIARKSKKPLVVVAPLRVAAHTWPGEIAKWAPELSYVVLHGPLKNDLVKLKRDIYIINYAGLKWLATQKLPGVGGILVFDESTAVKSYSSMTSKIAYKMRERFKKCFMLSATPSPNGWHDLFSQYRILDFGASLGTGLTNFMNKYFVTLPSRSIRPRDARVVNEIQKLVSPCTFRLDAEDYLKLPPYVVNKIELHLPEKLKRMYTQLEEDFVMQLNATTVTAVSAATLSMKLRQFVQGCMYTDALGNYEEVHNVKVEALEQILGELNGAPTLIPIQFKFELSQIRKRLGDIPAITGGASASKSIGILDAWNRGELSALIVHPASVSHGVNLQAGGHNIIWYSPTWNFEHFYQLNGRLRRQGQTKPVVLTFPYFVGTVEERIMKAINGKGANQQMLLDALKQG